MRAHYSKKRIIALIGGSGAGKTYYAPYWVLEQLKEPGKRLLAIGMGYEKHVERVMVHELIECFKRHDIPFTMNKSAGVITLWNGSQILLGSAENPQSLEGVHLDGGVWIDEGGQMPRIAWDVAFRRTHAKDAPILITSVPYFLNWLYTDIYQQYIKGGVFGEMIEWINCKSTDNLEYSRSSIELIKATKRPEYIEIYVEGNFARPYGLIYDDPPNQDVIFDFDTMFPNGMPEDWPCYSGHDFGINDPNAAIWGRLAPDNTLFIVAEYQAPSMTMRQHIERWRGAGLTEVDSAFGDPSGADQMLTAEENNFSMSKANNDILFGIDLVYDRFKSGKLKVARGCNQLLDYRSLYVWKRNPKNEDELMDQPENPQPARHLMDALRYLVTGIFENVQTSQPESTIFVRRKNYVA